MAASVTAAGGMVASSSGRSCGWSCAVRPPAAARHSCSGPRLRSRASSAAALPPGLEALAASSGGPDAADASTALLAAAREAAAQHSAAEHSSVYGLQALLASVGAYGAALWPDRPRGWCKKELVEVRQSEVAGRGVFARARIPAGTVLGAYPGRPRTPQGMAAKAEAAPGARDYCFRTRSGVMLDPTDASGALSPTPAPGLPWPLPVDVSLAYINEPPMDAGGTNVTVEDDPSDDSGLICVAARDIEAGEELFMDYGVTYDRSTYS